MPVPIAATWPPLLLLAAAVAVSILSYMAGLWFLAIPAMMGVFILVLDTLGRIRDFRHAALHLGRGRNPARVASTYKFSWCGRKACEAAARSVSREVGDAVASYYRNCGYRWFHIFPDNTFTRNSPFLTLRFWQITLGGNMYAPGASGETSRGKRKGGDRERSIGEPEKVAGVLNKAA